MKSGIYRILNTTNGKFYIGSSNNMTRRFKEHRYRLGKNSHSNPYLQAAWNKYGSGSFQFEVLEEVAIPDLLKVEQHYLSSSPEYNLARDAYAPTQGLVRTQASRDKVRTTMLAKKNKGWFFNPKINRYIAKIRLDGKIKYLGSFLTADQAHEAYLAALFNRG